MCKVLNRHARHQEILEDTVGDDLDALRWNAFVVELVGACEFHAGHFAPGGIVGDAEEFWQDFLSDFLREGLSFVLVALTMTLEAVPEYFMKENGSGAPAQQCGSGVRF